jgi:hypothetical protein
MLRLVKSIDVETGRRFEFIRCTGQYVVVDVIPSEHDEWSEQFPGESRWYPHEPSAEDLAALACSLGNVRERLVVRG